MATEAVDVIPDQLLTPLMAFLKAAVNSDIGEIMLAEAGKSVDAIGETLIRPQDLRLDPGETTRLSCYRARSRNKRITFGGTDKIATLQFDYVTPSCGEPQLEDRWPLLDRVWNSIVDAIEAGSHAAWNDGADVHEACGITYFDIETATKQEFYVDADGFTFPGFRGTLDLRWRPATEDTADTVYPALSFEAKIYTEGNVKTPDVTVIAYTPLGQEERDAQPFEDESELGGQL